MKILVIEDEQILNDYMCALLKDEYEMVSAINASLAIETINDQSLDLILCDIMLGSESGFTVLEYLRENHLKIPTIMLTALDDEENLKHAYDLGAVDYMVKPVNKQILKMKVRNMQKYFNLEDNEVLKDELDVDEKLQIVKINGEDIKLTKIEYQIFDVLSSSPERIFTKDNLIDVVWCGNHGMSSRIVDTNIFNLRKKLGLKSYIIKTKRGIGYYYENKK